MRRYRPSALLATLLLLLNLMNTCLAQPERFSASKDLNKSLHAEQWQVIDVSFKVSRPVVRPFHKVAFAVVSGAAKSQRIPLFYNGDQEWILRFSSGSVGAYRFVVESEISELDGRQGSFQISENSKPDRHGAVIVNAATPGRFFYEDGTHYTNLAFECDWLFALDYGNKHLSKTMHLLDLLHRFRFNQVVMNVYSYDVRWPKDPRLSMHPEHEYGSREDIFPFLGSNSKPDFSSLNVEFFKHLDRVLSEMHDREIVSHLMIYVWNKLVAWPDMNSPEDNLYYDYVLKRYQAFPNVIWDVSKEALHHQRATKEYIAERVQRTRRLDAFNRLVSVHDYGFCREHSELVDFISMQNWKHTLYEHMLEAVEEFPNKPVFNIEHGGYEDSPYVVFPGAYTNAEVCLRRNYLCLFAGGYTTYYWQGAAWNVIIHNPFEQPEEFVKPHFEYFDHMAKFMKIAEFEHCKPTRKFNSSGYSLTNKKSGIVLIYAPKENHYVGGKPLLKEFDCSQVTRQWFNTLTGELSSEEPYDLKQIGFWDDRPWRYEADAILIIRGLRPMTGQTQ